MQVFWSLLLRRERYIYLSGYVFVLLIFDNKNMLTGIS